MRDSPAGNTAASDLAAGSTAEQGLTWMIVEDSRAIRDILGTMCELWRFHALPFKDGHQACRYLEVDNPPLPLPDVALIDIRMPGPWGHEVAARIRQHPRLWNIGVILMTAHELAASDEDDYLEASGADALIYKPLPPMDDLLGLVSRVLAQRRALAS